MKWRKLRRSKWKFPTRIIRHSQQKGELVSGEKAAIANIERELAGGRLHYDKTKHTRTQWVFCVPAGQSFIKK